MSYKAYSNYVDTGITWLGKIPKHWKVVNSRRLFEQRKSRAFADDEQLTASQKYGIIRQKDFIRIEGREVVKVQTGSDILKHVEKGDFVISMRSFQGGLEYASLTGCVSSAYVSLCPIKNVSPHFFKHLFKSRRYIEALQSTSNLVRDGQALRFDNFSLVRLPIVPLDEQRQIASFLDRECGKMDSLMEKQQKLIALLKEKRQAVITQAVTKGIVNSEFGSLNAHLSGERLKSEERRVKELTTSNFTPQTSNFEKVYTTHTSPLKPTNIQWLGEVPEGWKVGQFQFAIVSIDQGKSPECENRQAEHGEWAVLKSGCVNNGIYDENQHKALPSNVKPFIQAEVKQGDLLLCRASGSINLLGSVGYVHYTREKLLLSDKTFRLKTTNFNTPIYIWYVMGSHSIRRQIEIAVNGADGLANNITKEAIKSLNLAYPPLSEQQAIVAYLDSTCGKIDQLISKAEQAITLLKERRTALISAAVTGKIDVRGETSEGKGLKEKG